MDHVELLQKDKQRHSQVCWGMALSKECAATKQHTEH
jgi:hypothetical protein